MTRAGYVGAEKNSGTVRDSPVLWGSTAPGAKVRLFMNAARTLTIFSNFCHHRHDLSFPDLHLRPRRIPIEHNLLPLLGTTPRARRSWSSQWLGFGCPVSPWRLLLHGQHPVVGERGKSGQAQCRTPRLVLAAVSLKWNCGKTISYSNRRRHGIIDFRKYPIFSVVGSYGAKRGSAGLTWTLLGNPYSIDTQPVPYFTSDKIHTLIEAAA